MAIESLLSRLSHVRPSGKDKWRAQCPLHDKGRDALAIRQDGDMTLIHCFSCGGGAHEICASIGMDIAELMPERETDPLKPRKPIKAWPAKWVLEALHKDIRTAYVLFADIQKGKQVQMSPESARMHKERMLDLIRELDRAY